MRKRGKKRNRYQFTDSSVAVDTIISFVMAGISILIELAAVINSIASKGHIHDIFGTLFIIVILLSVVGECFAWFGMRDLKGGVKSKRISVALNIFSLVVMIAFFVAGLL